MEHYGLETFIKISLDGKFTEEEHLSTNGVPVNMFGAPFVKASKPKITLCNENGTPLKGSPFTAYFTASDASYFLLVPQNNPT
jgi:hypothetical protein